VKLLATMPEGSSTSLHLAAAMSKTDPQTVSPALTKKGGPVTIFSGGTRPCACRAACARAGYSRVCRCVSCVVRRASCVALSAKQRPLRQELETPEAAKEKAEGEKGFIAKYVPPRLTSCQPCHL